MLDLTKPVYVRQSFCSRAPCDEFVQGAVYAASSDHAPRAPGRLGLLGPAILGGKTYPFIYMEVEIANCSNTPWPTEAPAQEKPLNDRIAELYLEAKSLLPDSLVPYYLKKALKRADGDIRFAQRKEQGIA